MIKIITVQGVLSKKEIHGPEFKGNKPGINGIRTRKAIATNQILPYGVSVCYSFEIIKKKNASYQDGKITAIPRVLLT